MPERPSAIQRAGLLWARSTSSCGSDLVVPDADLARRIERLTPGQWICLSLVAQHMSSKEIALRLGLSPHTVDQRLRQALHTLDVSHRKDAVRLLLNFEVHPRRSFPTPFATGLQPKNNLTLRWRLTWIVLIAIGIALAVGLFLAALTSVAEMFES